MHTTESRSYIPSQAYLYFPTEREQRGVDGQRMIFDGNMHFSNHEHQSINQFRSYAMKHKYTLTSIWTDNMILRFLYANSFKMDRTLHSVKDHTAWRQASLPVRVDQPLLNMLNSGLLYIHGRDNKFRPIVVFNVYMVNPKTMDIDLMLRVLTFWFEHIINDWMLPGQIENWVFIVNMKGMGIAALAMQSVRKLFAYLQENYKCRLHSLYVLNTPSAVYIPWQVVKKFLDEVTVKKIQFLKGNIPDNLFTHANREQVEVQYGGSAPNIKQYWPPTISSDNYFVAREDQKSLMTEEQYITMYRNGLLRGMKINQSLVAPKQVMPKQVILKQETPRPSHIWHREDLSTEEDYVDDMSEWITSKESKHNIKEFSASFLEDLNGYSRSVPSKDSLPDL